MNCSLGWAYFVEDGFWAVASMVNGAAMRAATQSVRRVCMSVLWICAEIIAGWGVEEQTSRQAELAHATGPNPVAQVRRGGGRGWGRPFCGSRICEAVSE